MASIDDLANTEIFLSATQGGRGEQIVWFLFDRGEKTSGVTVADVVQAFIDLGHPRPNPTRLRARFRKSPNVRVFSKGFFAPTRKFCRDMEATLPRETIRPDDHFDVDGLEIPPFLHESRLDDLKNMINVYARLFLLENSMRGLIEKVLFDKFGADWWAKSASASMKRKQEVRLKNEESKKWAPTRSDFGPLFALDWPDLITVMRKFPEDFLPYLGEVNFLHRYEDAGSFRNVVAHNGAIQRSDDVDLIRIYYRNWIDQMSKPKSG